MSATSTRARSSSGGAFIVCEMAAHRLESAGRRGVGSTAPTLTSPTCKEVEMADKPINGRRPRGQSKKGISGRFWERVSPEPNSGCWIWTGAATAAGYGQMVANRKHRYAHRISYEMHVGAIPNGLELDHRCRNTFCVNPDHLEPVTHAENVRRGLGPERAGKRQRDKTRCPNGHPYTEGNIYYRANGNRDCRICSIERSKAFQRNRGPLTPEQLARKREVGREWMRRRRAAMKSTV
jgi:hypothetical protein